MLSLSRINEKRIGENWGRKLALRVLNQKYSTRAKMRSRERKMKKKWALMYEHLRF